MTPEQRTKLPKWAQEHIQDLERKLLQKDETIRCLRKENPVSTAWYCDDERECNVYLPEGVPISFGDSLGKDQIWVHYSTWQAVMALRVSSQTRLIVRPSAANSIYVIAG